MVFAHMLKVSTAHTAYVEPSVLAAARALLDDVFSGEMTDADWEHALGGMHALAWEHDVLIGHASVIQRRLWLDGRALRTGYVEGVGVRGDRRRRGVAGALLDESERLVAANGYARAWLAVAVGNARARRFYERRGWLDEGVFDYPADGPDGPVPVPCHRYAKPVRP
jgi:aminoglycoside 2'-N-acetyltransferase I